MTSKISQAKPGRRPRGDADQVRRALLKAAKDCFVTKPFAAVSIRELARTAGVNAAMINYYFGGKAGLYMTLFEETVGPALSKLAEEADGGGDLDAVIRLYLCTLGAHPWLPRLLVRDILSSDSPLQEVFARRVAGRAGVLIRRLIANAQDAGRLRADVDPRLAALSVISLCVFPLVAAPVAGRALMLDDSADDYLETLITHNTRLLKEGIYQ